MAAPFGEMTQEAKAALPLVEAHLQEHFSLSATQVDITPLPGLGHIPNGAIEFVVRMRSQMDGMTYNYIVFDGRVYCGTMKGEFERFLADYRLFEKNDLNAEQVFNLYVLLGPTQHLSYMDERTIVNSGFTSLKPPALSNSKKGLQLTFYARPMADLQARPTLWTVTLLPDYRLTIEEGAAAPAQ